ncbi:MAG: DUF4249 domain-containing protein [Prolixibacteraceae bacterium]|nr:DUF4249 domain-containing protein [Prolixibacteraceae bacterium]
MAKYVILTIALSVVLNACMKEVEFDEKIIESKLVVNGFVCADSLIKVQLAVSHPITGVQKRTEWIDNATIKLYIDGEFSEELQNVKIEYNEEEFYDNYSNSSADMPESEYQSITTIAQAGKIYKIEIECDGFEMAWAETTIPEKVIIDTVRTEIKEVIEYGYTENRKFYYTKFSDPQTEKNYYRIALSNSRGYRETIWNDTTYQYEIVDSIKRVYVSYNFDPYIQSDDPLLNGNEDADDYLFMGPDNEYKLFNDDLINGQDYELSFNEYYYNYGDENTMEIEGEFEHSNIRLMTLSREAYLYIKSSYEHMYYDEDFLSEPVQVYTNINNGIGIFAGYSFDEYSIGKGEYPIDSFEYIYSNYY